MCVMPKPVFQHILPRNIYVQTTLMTQGVYYDVLGENPSVFQGDLERPVENITWGQAVDFCNKYSEAMGYQPVYFKTKKGDVKWDKKKRGYRLPTLVEWKYLARARKPTYYSGSSKLDRVGWYGLNSEGVTHPVGLKAPNDFGLYDMSGNVAEWCWDGPDLNSGLKYAMGGSWADMSEKCSLNSDAYAQYAHVGSVMVGLRVII